MKTETNRTRLTAILIAGLFLLTGTAPLAAQQAGDVPTRDEIDDKYKWNVTALFASDSDWEAAFGEAEKKIDELAGCEGHLGRSAKDLLECLRLRDDVGMRMDRLSSYTERKLDEDLNNTACQAMSQRVRNLETRHHGATAFFEPELLAIEDGKLEKFMKAEEGLRIYGHYLDDVRRMKDHILPREQERLLSLLWDVTRGASRTYDMLVNADFDWGKILDEKSNEMRMSRSRYYLYMYSPDRRVRRDAYMEMYVPFENHLNTLASLLLTKLKTDLFYSRARNYGSTLERALSGPNIPVEVYYNLVNTLNDNLAPLHRWAALKKRVLRIDELHPYDTYAPLFPEVERMYTYEEAQGIVKEALKPLGGEVQDILDRAFAERWIDVYESVGKSDGAYSSGTYGVHPYILMNFNGTLNSVFTLAHELGHTVHSYLTNANQPFIYSDYETFAAEVASTTNEALLMDYLLENAMTDGEKLCLLQQYIQDIGSTFYRQGRFAEFELAIHRKVANDEPLTHESISKIFGEIYQKYWGPDMVVDEQEKLSWVRISHFFSSYYVYTYATSFAASELIARRIKEEGSPAVEDYLKFLRSGGSLYPIELLRTAGVDMSTRAPIEATTDKMDELLDRMEEIMSGR